MTPEQIARARELLAEATPRPWSMLQHGAPESDWEILGPDSQQALATATETDAELICEGPDLLEDALAEIVRLRSALAERERQLAAALARPDEPSSPWVCPSCGHPECG